MARRRGRASACGDPADPGRDLLPTWSEDGGGARQIISFGAGSLRIGAEAGQDVIRMLAQTRGGLIDHMTAYRDEVADRIARGVGICEEEKTRLLWLNNGLWFNTPFYRYFEQSHGATFVSSMYSNILSDRYRKYFDDDPLRALAARHISMNEQLHLPPWMAEWILKQAKDFGAAGAVMLTPVADRMSSMGTRLCKMALEKAGLPVMEIKASAVDARLWDDDKMRAEVGRFIEERCQA